MAKNKEPKILTDRPIKSKKSNRSQKPKDKYKQPLYIKKSNRIIEARYYLSLWEMRIFQEMIERIEPDAETFQPAFIPIKSFAKKFGASGGYAYEQVRIASVDLSRRIVHIVEEGPHGGRLVMRPLAVRVDIPIEEFPNGDANSYVVLKFNEELKPELLQLSKNYTQYIAELTTLLNTSYAIRIYEIMSMIRFRREREFTLKEFREMIGALSYRDGSMKYVDKNVAKTYAELNRSILRPSHQQIEERTDIRFDYEPVYESTNVKVGKPRIVGILFFNVRLKTESKVEFSGGAEPEDALTLPPAVTEHYLDAQVVDAPTRDDFQKEETTLTDLFGQALSPQQKKRGRPTKAIPEGDVDQVLVEKAVALGITRTYLKIAFETHTPERIRAALELLQRKSIESGGKKVGNPTGYFYTLVNTDGLETQFEAVASARNEAQELVDGQRQKAQHLSRLKKELMRLEDERTQATNDIYQDQINALTELFTIDPQFHRIVFDQVVALPYLKMIVPDLIQKYRQEYLYKTQVYTHFFNEALTLRPDESLFAPILLSMEQLALTEQRIEAIKAELKQG